MLVTDCTRCGPQGLRAAVATAIDAGVDAVQVRDKNLPAKDLYELALLFRAMTRDRCALLVNDRLDVALAAEADGVHLPESGLPIAAAIRAAPPEFIVGRSVHSAEAAAIAQAEGASYVELGTIFETASKPGLSPAGLALVRSAAATLTLPCIAIGGVDAGNAGAVLAAGASGIAVVSAILQAADVAAAVGALRKALAGAVTPARA